MTNDEEPRMEQLREAYVLIMERLDHEDVITFDEWLRIRRNRLSLDKATSERVGNMDVIP